MHKVFSLVLSLAVLTSCSTPNMDTSKPLLADEGIVLTTCKTPNALDRIIEIYPEDFKPSLTNLLPPSVNCSQQGNLATIKLPAGIYYVGSTKDMKNFKHLPQFTVQPNKITYIGDLRIAVKETNIAVGLLVGFNQPEINISILDKASETIQSLKDKKPEIATKYEIISDIARKK